MLLDVEIVKINIEQYYIIARFVVLKYRGNEKDAVSVFLKKMSEKIIVYGREENQIVKYVVRKSVINIFIAQNTD